MVRGRTLMCDSWRSRILYITHATPIPDKVGPSRRHYHILDQLSRFYDVHLLSLGNACEMDMFARNFPARLLHFDFAPRHGSKNRNLLRKAWRTARGRCDFQPSFEPNLRRLCSRVALPRSFDAIFLSAVLLRGLPLPTGIPIIGDTHNVDFNVLRRTSTAADSFLRRQHARLQWPLTRREEQRAAQNVNLLLATSERDRQLFEEELLVRGVEVIPNGIDVAEFAPTSIPSQPETVLFTGLMSYYPNQHGMRWFLNSVFPLVLQKLPGAKLIVAGTAPPHWLTARRGSKVEVTGPVLDMRPYFERASVAIAPLFIGGGTRVKILEAQAMGKPVVSTSLGAEGLGQCHGESILIADDAESFGGHVVRLLSDRDLAANIGANGRSHAVRHFDWNRIGERLGRLLQSRIGLAPHEASQDSGRHQSRWDN